MKSIILIHHYFGQLKNFFPLFLNSAKNNPTVDFLIVTDQDFQCSAKNIRIIHTSFEEFKKKVESLYDFPVLIDRAYKLCDFRVAYGELFSDEIKNYDFWGTCDSDLIFGDIRKFVPDELLEKYDKIGTCDHFTLYRNIPEINSIYRKIQNPSIQEAFTHSNIYYFSEWGGASLYWRDYGLLQYEGFAYDDLRVGFDGFHLTKEVPGYGPLSSYNVKGEDQSKEYRKYKKIIYHYKNGKLIRCYYCKGKYNETEVFYIHIQRRPMQILLKDLDSNDYYVINDSFIDSADYSKEMHKKIKSDTMHNKMRRVRNHIMTLPHYKERWNP